MIWKSPIGGIARSNRPSVIEAKGGLRLMASDGKAARAAELDEVALTYYEP
jgi:hypothetical protein